jgi:hypothetical protein
VNAGVLGGNLKSPRDCHKLVLESSELNLTVAAGGALPAITHTVMSQVLSESS